MGQHSDKVNILKKYSNAIATLYPFYVGDDIPENKLKNAIASYGYGLDKGSVIGLYDITLTGNAKEGLIISEQKIYYREWLVKPQKIWFDDIDHIVLSDTDKKDKEQTINIYLKDGTCTSWNSLYINKPALQRFLNEMSEYEIHRSKEAEVSAGKNQPGYSRKFDDGEIAAGLGVAGYHEVNKGFEEEKFHAAQGHGFAAERANNLYDNLTGKRAKIVGDDNAKNGADRIVKEAGKWVEIQSKYCQTGQQCVDNCFDASGQFRYFSSNGQPMQIEVPSDKYEAAVQAMQEKIKNGQVKGVSDPKEAENIIRKGHFTYNQAKNIAKAGTVESLTYDAVNGTIIAASAFGVTALISFATSIWGGEDFDKALKIASYSGLKVGGTAFITTVLASQLSKAGLNSALVGSSEAVVAFMGPKASAVLINAFRNGSNIYGAAAMKSAAKLLRGNTITAGITIVVLSAFDVANIFQGRISGKQLFKNVANTTTTVAGGTGGWIAGAAIGSAMLPGVGTVVGGLIGSLAAGAAAGKATEAVLGNFIEDDADEMVRIIQNVFTQMCDEYLLSQKEAEKSVDKLRDILTGNKLKDMYASSDRQIYARNMLTPIIEEIVSKREHIRALTDEDMVKGVRGLLEDISDANEQAVPAV